MKTNKTFRLFISSTFNDFREERKVLQTKVFPIIKKYCIEKGYHFQPIDLRWGINNEAQLDQKTLELCLEEVRACKSYPFPNFLVMLGDRYGWIPLPYTIEQKEFEEILNYTQPNKQKELLKWYTLDKNQLPASYVLKQREGAYTNADKWSETETILLHILQQSVQQTTFNKQQKQKYFTSATEAEIIEGIYNYEQPTAYQKKIASTNPEIKKYDADYTFGFIRNIPIATKKANKFIANKEDYDKSQKVKNKIKEVLSAKNRCEVITNQISEEAIETDYLVDFEKRVIQFLKNKLKEQIEKGTTYTSLEIEQQEQAYFAKQKRKNFIGQETILGKIADYLTNDIQQVFVLYGKSGSGKSSIIAKAIEETEKTHNVIYRFVGATSHSSSITSLIKSIFNQLGISIKNETSFNSKNETFEEFSLRIKNKILSINNPVVIFIDAVDQLTHNDTFLWLPEILPSNVKIVISALNDPNYQQDSFYFRSLQKITKNVHLIEQFNNPQKLLLALLKKENRTLQKHQINYFITQYKNSRTPLYVYIASQELKHWKSFDVTPEQDALPNQKTQKLANSQKEIIQEFISNLSTFYHHDKNFVQKVLAHIYASKEGLSQNEILELINTDTHFIKQVAPETFHKNENKELPLVIWTRLFYQLKPFLNKKQQDNEELLFFFHREFIDVVKNMMKLKTYHENLIDSILILLNKKKSFDRYWKIFSETLGHYILTFKKINNSEDIDKNSFISHKWILSLKKYDKSFIRSLIRYNQFKWNELTNSNYMNNIVAYLIAKTMYDYMDAPYKWSNLYVESLSQMSKYYKIVNFYNHPLNIKANSENYLKKTNGLRIINKDFNSRKKEHAINSLRMSIKRFSIISRLLNSNRNWIEDYILSAIELGNSYRDNSMHDKSINILKKTSMIIELMLSNYPKQWNYQYVSCLFSMGLTLEKMNLEKETQKIYKKVYDISLEEFLKNKKIWASFYAESLGKVANYSNNEIEKIKTLKKSNSIWQELFNKNADKWAKKYFDSSLLLIEVLSNLKNHKHALKLREDLYKYCLPLYHKNTNKWERFHSENLFEMAIINEKLNKIEKANRLWVEGLRISQDILSKLNKSSPEFRDEDLVAFLSKKTISVVDYLANKGEYLKARLFALRTFDQIKYINKVFRMEVLSTITRVIELEFGKVKVELFLCNIKKHFNSFDKYFIDLELLEFYKNNKLYSKAINVIRNNLMTNRHLTQPKSFYKNLAEIENLRGNTNKTLEYLKIYIESDQLMGKLNIENSKHFKNLKENFEFRKLLGKYE